jgi:hypothetical protein
VARVHALTDEVAAAIIVIRIVVVISVGSKTKSYEATPMKSAGEATMEATTVEAATVEAATVKTTSAKAAAVETTASKATTVTTTAAAVTTATATAAASKRRRRLNQADSRQRDQRHHPFTYHACLRDLKSPT